MDGDFPQGDHKGTGMVEREWGRFVVDVRRFRPLITVVLMVLVMLPSLNALLTAGLSPFAVLVRLAETMFVMNFVTWCGAKLVTRYAKIQAREESNAKMGKVALGEVRNNNTDRHI